GTRSGSVWFGPFASGDTTAGVVIPIVLPSHFLHTHCSSQNAPILLRWLTCHVRRPLVFSHVRSEYPGWFRSGWYSHFVGSPAFRLTNWFAFTRVLPCVRAVTKYQMRSFLIGPPAAAFKSYTLVNGVGAERPVPAVLSDCRFLPLPL